MAFGLLATSYAPGHNFWHGTPIDWCARGALAFILMAGPVLIAWLLAVLMARRMLRLWWLLAVVVLLAFGLLTNSLHLRDGDMPFYLGGRLGQQLAPWLAGAAILSTSVAAVWRGREEKRRGFEVVTK